MRSSVIEIEKLPGHPCLEVEDSHLSSNLSRFKYNDDRKESIVPYNDQFSFSAVRQLQDQFAEQAAVIQQALGVKGGKGNSGMGKLQSINKRQSSQSLGADIADSPRFNTIINSNSLTRPRQSLGELSMATALFDTWDGQKSALQAQGGAPLAPAGAGGRASVVR